MIRNVVTRIVFIWIAIMIVVALLGDVSVAASDVGRTGADFLRIGHGARAAGLGGAYTALSHGASAAYWNPAGLSNLEGFEVSLGHFAWFQDISVEQASLALPLNAGPVLGASITYVNYGDIAGFDADGNATGDLTAYDLAVGLSVGHALDDHWSAGLTGKWVSQKLDQYNASAFAADLGLRYTGSSFVVGATVTNVGSKLTFDETAEDLPAAFQVGVAILPFGGAVATSLDFYQPFQGDLIIRQGLELGFSERYYLRTGYDYLPGQDGRQLATSISLGAGLRFDFGDFDYSFTPNDKSTSEDLHRFTLSLRMPR